MSTTLTPSYAPTAGTSSWSPFWIELPFLVACAALCVVMVVALYRARPEDIPRLFASFGAVLARLGWRMHAEAPSATPEQEDLLIAAEPDHLPTPQDPNTGIDYD